MRTYGGTKKDTGADAQSNQDTGGNTAEDAHG
jgi:hypothetical protein